MQCFMILFLYLLFVHGSEGITTHSVTGCSNNINISCNNTEMIHVERITFYNGTDSNEAVTDLQVCGEPLTGSDTGLIPSCNGKTSCNETIYYNPCRGSRAARVDYRCIPRNDVKDMCDSFIIKHTGRTFIKTQNFPSRPTFTDISPCRCFIRGSSITSIQILELLLLTSDDGIKSSLEVNYGDGTYKTESISDTSLIRRVYNKILSTTSISAEITLNHAGSNRNYVWIEIQGVDMHVACNIERTSRPSATTPLPSPLPSPSPTPEKVEGKYTTIIIFAVLLCLCLLILCIQTIIVLLRRQRYVLVTKPPEKKRILKADQESQG